MSVVSKEFFHLQATFWVKFHSKQVCYMRNKTLILPLLIYLFTYLFVCLFIYLFVCYLFIFLSIYICVYVFIYFCNPCFLDIVKIIPLYNSGSKLLHVWVRQHFAFLPKVEESIRGTPIKQFNECLIFPIFQSPKSSETVF